MFSDLNTMVQFTNHKNIINLKYLCVQHITKYSFFIVEGMKFFWKYIYTSSCESEMSLLSTYMGCIVVLPNIHVARTLKILSSTWSATLVPLLRSVLDSVLSILALIALWELSYPILLTMYEVGPSRIFNENRGPHRLMHSGNPEGHGLFGIHIWLGPWHSHYYLSCMPCSFPVLVQEEK